MGMHEEVPGNLHRLCCSQTVYRES